ncbi:hypothetical protein [Pseudobacillus wudalianchiensis]|uniref:Uncharacterized protein n=1 Tax=Pseudobacillus wudalianchiensis TaxID=1743143 RepID=A0A1B9B935_9BACI|nr:hypothetical protein [Bacillus wudalianchiensis]OCA92593.1 hypothetical protein A8F95_02540 [Bacillus wudalianchiensis]
MNIANKVLKKRMILLIIFCLAILMLLLGKGTKVYIIDYDNPISYSEVKASYPNNKIDYIEGTFQKNGEELTFGLDNNSGWRTSRLLTEVLKQTEKKPQELNFHSITTREKTASPKHATVRVQTRGGFQEIITSLLF